MNPAAAISGICQVSPGGEMACFSETGFRPGSTAYLSRWKAAGVTREFPTSSYLSRKRQA